MHAQAPESEYANFTIIEFRGMEEASNGPLTRLIRKRLHY